MTIDISANAARVTYSLGAGSSQQAFTVSFEFFEDSDLKVYVDDTLKSISTHYAVSGGSGSTGTVTFGSALTGITGGSKITITRATVIERTTDFSSGADINRAALNTQLDTITAIAADNRDRINRTMTVSDFEIPPSLVLPSLASRKGKVLGFNSSTGSPQADTVVVGAAVTVSTVSVGGSATATVALNSAGIATFALGIPTGATGATGQGALLVNNNLSDLASASSARTNLGLGTAATSAATNFVAVTGDSMTGNLNFGDNDKAIFGAGSDLQIYHDGSNSVVSDTGTGGLLLKGNGTVELQSALDNEAMLVATVNGALTAYHNGSPKLATTSTGVDITGTVTATGTSVFASLDISGNIDVDGTTNLDVVDIDGAVNFAADVTFANGADIITATAGTSNFRAGVNAGNSIASGGSYNVVVGDEAGTAITTGDNNNLFGFGSGESITTGQYNSAFGSNSLDALTTGTRNTAFGNDTLSSDTLGSRAVAVGLGALQNQNFTSATDNYNVAVGFQAGNDVTTGTHNTLIGGLAGDAITTGTYNTAIGYNALTANTTATNNVSVGAFSLGLNTTGEANTAVGLAALDANTTGSNNVALGASALSANTTAANATAVGYQAMLSNTTGGENVAIGREALRTMTTANANTAVGYQAGNFTTTGANNTFIGRRAGYAVTTGAGNTFIGGEAGDGLTTGSSCIFIGKSATESAVGTSNQTVLGTGVTCVGDSNFTFGGGSTDSNIAFGATSISAPSDQRYKEEIADATAGLSFIKDLRPVTFKWKKEKDLPTSHRAYVEGSETRTMNDYINHGFIAQEVKTVIDAHSEIKNGFDMWCTDSQDDGGRQRLADGALIPMLVKSLQELSTALDAALARIATLEG